MTPLKSITREFAGAAAVRRDRHEGNAHDCARLAMSRRFILSVAVGLGASTAWANPAQDRLTNMSEVERSEALAVFVESGGHTCRTVARTFFQGEDTKGNVFWNVTCAGGESYVVVIKNDVSGSTRVMNCRRLRAATGTDCFKALE
jgi:hypothetical protein